MLARRQSVLMAQRQRQSPADDSLGGPWLPVGPAQVVTAAFGRVTGRVSSVAIDPADLSGNTVYVGATGGGVWRSTNAAADPTAVSFAPLTDGLPGSLAAGEASLSIGAVTVQPGGTGVILAGTGDPNDAMDSYWGSGILRSADGGNTWALITQSNETFHSAYVSRLFAGEAFAGFAWSTATAGLVVAAVSESSEGIDVNAPEASSQPGVYYSTDAGATWWLATMQDPGGGLIQAPQLAFGLAAAATAITWNPVRQRFYAAMRFHGYYESSDGINWTRLASQPGVGLSTALCPSAYSSVACPIFRGALAVQPVTGDLFALTTDINNINQGLWQDSCSAASGVCSSATVNFQSLPSQPLEDSSAVIPQGDYNLWLAAVAVNHDTVLYAGTEDILKCSLAAGCAWRNTTNVNGCGSALVAPAQHAVDASFAGAAGTAGLMYFGNDGGLWRSTDGIGQTAAPCSADDATHFQNLNGGLGSLAEITDMAVDPTNSTVVLAAQGALGTSATGTAGQTAWPQVLDGEGSKVAIDPQSPGNWFAASSGGVGIHACALGDACTLAAFGPTIIGSAQVGGDGDALTYPAPWILDPQDTARIIIGTCRVWRGPTSGGSGWSASNALSLFLDGTGPNQNTPVCTSNALVRSLAASGSPSDLPAKTEMLYAGMAGSLDGGSTAAGRIFAAAVSGTPGATPIWTDLSASPVSGGGQFNPNGFAVSSIAVDPHDSTGMTLYATLAGFSRNGANAPLLYSSTDGGAHWLDLTSNLPHAPANTVIVDPNDANTLYIGLDTGVYVTHQIGTCATATCWSLYGTGLPNAPIVKLSVFGGSPSMLRAATYGRGIWQTALGVTQTTATLTPVSLTFAAQAVSTPSAAQTLTLANTGAVPLSIAQIAASAGYSETDNCNGSLVVGANCALQVVFNPSQVGAQAGTVVVSANVPTGQLTATMNGTGVAGASIVPLPAALAFGNEAVGSTTASQAVSISNGGSAAVAMASRTVTGDYQIVSDSCGASLAAGSGCAVAVVFSPTAAGSRPGALNIADGQGTQTVPLSGTGQATATDVLSPLSLTFAAQIVNTGSAVQAVTLTNAGDQALTAIAAAVTGDFTLDNRCGNMLVGHSSCVLNVAYLPSRAGSASGALTVTDALHAQATANQTVALSGTGIPAAVDTVSPLTLVFAGQAQNTLSAAQTVTLTDSSSAALTLISAQTTGDFVLNGGCAPTLQGHSSCGFSVSYLPTVAGPETGTLVVDDANGAQTVSLSGSGLTATGLLATPGALSFGAENLGVASPAETVTLQSQSAAAISSLAIAVSGDYQIADNTCPAALPAGTACTVQIVFTPTASGARPGALTASSPSLPAAVVVPLTGSGQAGATDNLSPSKIAFGNQALNTPSIVQQVTLTNSGDAVLGSIAAHTSGSFILESGCGPSLAAHSTCQFSLEFLPTTTGVNNGTLVVTDSLETQVVPLSGVGLSGAADSLTPLLLAFGNQTLATRSSPQLVTLTNGGDSDLTGIAVQISGDFSMSDGCGTVLAAKTSCTITVTYQPTVVGAETGVLTVADALRSQSVALTGTGVIAPTDALTPTSLTFFVQALNTTSPPQAVTLTNSGGASLTGITAAITGDFVLSNGCAATLAAQANCVFNVSFMPTHTGVETGVLTVTDAIRTQTVALNGPIQIPPTDTLSASTLVFGSQAEGSPSPPQTVTMSNTGQATLTGITTKTTGDFSVASTCGTALAGATDCTLSVVYTPTHTGAAVGTLTVTDVLQAQKVALSGTGTASTGGTLFSLGTVGAITATITSGQGANFGVSVQPSAVGSGTVALSCTGLPQFSACSFSPASIALVAGGAATASTVQVSTGVGVSASSAPPARPGRDLGRDLGRDWRRGRIELAALAVLPLALSRRRKWKQLMALALLLAAVTIAPLGCGGVSLPSTGTGHQNVTPPGTYQITFTGTDGSEQHSVTVTLVVSS